MNKVQRRKIKRSSNLKLLFFTFFGAFILFFVAFTYVLPVITPKVEIPALTEDHVFNSITSNDFRGRVDPRLRSLELQEDQGSVKQIKPDKKPEISPDQAKTPVDSISNEDKWEQKKNEIPLPGASSKKPGVPVPGNSPEKKNIRAAKPPRPTPTVKKERVEIAPPAPIFKSKVVVGDFTSPKEAQMTMEILLSLDYDPFVRERNGNYILQVASFANDQRAKELVQELKNRNFDARVIYE